MRREQAFKRRNRYHFYNRAESSEWSDDYNQFQMEWLFKHKMVRFSEPMVEYGENPNKKYIEFTKKGLRWNRWYSCGLFDYIMIYVLRKYWWKRLWCKFMIKCGKHYDWQDYSND